MRRTRGLPLPTLLQLSRASQHDLTTLRELDPDLGGGYLFGDKAYADEQTMMELAGRWTHLVTPHKRSRWRVCSAD